MLRLNRLRVLTLAAVCGACVGCTGPAGDAEPADALTEQEPSSVPASSPAPSWHVGCIRGGSTPAEVRAAIGEPDSIVQGWWIYGRTQIRFAYGTVQDWIDSSNVVVC